MKKIFMVCAAVLCAGCAAPPLSKQAFRFQPPLYKNSDLSGAAKIRSSGEKKFESKNGTPKVGELAICTESGIRATSNGKDSIGFISAPPNKKIVVTSIMQWNNAGWEGTCWPLVSFFPENNSEYVVVNEVIGGKGLAGLWAGIAFQSCEVSVCKIVDNLFAKVVTEKEEAGSCKKQ